MNFTMIAVLSALFGGIANILVKRVVKDIKPEHALGPGFLFVAVVLALFSPLFYH